MSKLLWVILTRRLLLAMAVILVTGVAYYLISGHSLSKASPPSTADVLDAINGQTSFCWEAKVKAFSNGSLKERAGVKGCINYENGSAIWVRDIDGRKRIIHASKNDSDDPYWRMALEGWGAEWNVMNFLRKVLKEGKLESVRETGEGYEMELTFNWGESYSAGTIENGTRVTASHVLKLSLLVDGDGRPLGGNFTEDVERNYLDWNRVEGERTEGSFELLGPWES